MFINKDSVTMNNINMGQYLKQVEYQYNKLWSSDSGRNLAGKQTGTLIGIFPKLIFTFRRLSKDELNIIAPIINSANQTITYYDPDGGTKTITTYAGDWTYTSKSINSIGDSQCSFISVDRRT